MLKKPESPVALKRKNVDCLPKIISFLQVSQIGVSACGATAVINVLQALPDTPQPTLGQVVEAVPTKLRAHDAPVATYLFSRAVAGTDHNDLIQRYTHYTQLAL